MKSLKIALVALMFTVLLGTQAKAHNNRVNGLIIGTAVGSIVGLMIGIDIDRNSYRGRHVNHQPVVYAPPPPPTRYYGSNNHSRHNYRFTHNRRDVLIDRDQHSSFRKVVKTTNRERR